MKRREFIALAGGATAAWPLAARHSNRRCRYPSRGLCGNSSLDRCYIYSAVLAAVKFSHLAGICSLQRAPSAASS